VVSHGTVVAVLGEQWPAKVVSYLEPISRWDSGFMVVLEDVSEPEEVSGDEPCEAVCLPCLLDEHPELGRGFDLARSHRGTARCDSGEWVSS
jgi:hypothetical protein